MAVKRTKASKAELDAWWQEFGATADEGARNRIIENFLPIVKYTAERVHAKLPDEVDVDDLISAGIFGLVDAVNAFDPARGGVLSQEQTVIAHDVQLIVQTGKRPGIGSPRLAQDQYIRQFLIHGRISIEIIAF